MLCRRGASLSGRMEDRRMCIKEKLLLMAETERRNSERWKEFAKKEDEKHARVQVLLHEWQSDCDAYAS